METLRQGSADADATARVSPLLIREARLLDSARYEEWLELWAVDGVLWVPLDPNAGPTEDQSLFLDDQRRLRERVAWRGEASAWGQQPASITVRIVGGIEAWPQGEQTLARSTLLLSETRRGRTQLLAGHQIHEFSADGTIRTKILHLPQLALGVPNPSFVL